MKKLLIVLFLAATAAHAQFLCSPSGTIMVGTTSNTGPYCNSLDTLGIMNKPSTSTAGDLVTFSDSNGHAQDSGTLLGALATTTAMNSAISTAISGALNSPTMTGTPTAPTATSGTNTTQLATTAFVQSAVPKILSTTTSFGGSLISHGCTAEPAVTISGATTSMSCNISASGAAPTNGTVDCSVTATNTVTPRICTGIALGITPSTITYNIRVF